MFKRIIIYALCILLLDLVIPPTVFASNSPEKEARLLEKVKAGIAKIGTGPEAKVELKLKDGQKLKGYITEINNEKFFVMDSKTGESIPVSYSQVKQAKGHNLSSKTVFTIVIISLIILPLVLLHVQRKNT